MKQLKNAKSGLFLLELIFVILFFSLGSAVCIQAFTKAHLTSQKAQDLSFASLKASETASVLKYTDNTLESLREYFPHIQEKDGNFLFFYNQDYEECEEKDRFYTLHITRKTESHMQTARIQITRLDNKTSIYQLSLRFPLSEAEPGENNISLQEAGS